MKQPIQEVESKYRKPKVVDVRSGDVVRVHQRIKEGNKERVQVFEGLVIRTDRKNSLSSRITVRRIASGVGVEKSFLLHSPLIEKIEVVKRSKVRRNYLSYMRGRSGKRTKLAGIAFDKDDVNLVSIDEQLDQEVGKVEEAQPKPTKPASEAEEAKPKDEAEPAQEPKAPEAKSETPAKPAEKPESEEAKSEKSESKPLTKEEKAKLKKAKAEAFRQTKEKK